MSSWPASVAPQYRGVAPSRSLRGHGEQKGAFARLPLGPEHVCAQRAASTHGSAGSYMGYGGGWHPACLTLPCT
jgi:hypothetical protein